MEARWSDGEVVSVRGSSFHQISLVGGQGETRLYEIVRPPELRGRHALSVAVAGENKVSWAQNYGGIKIKRDDK